MDTDFDHGRDAGWGASLRASAPTSRGAVTVLGCRAVAARGRRRMAVLMLLRRVVVVMMVRLRLLVRIGGKRR